METPSQDPSNEQALPHKLAAILYADVEGYSRLTGADEVGTHRTLSAYLDLFAETIKAHRGEVKHYAGDAVLADFTTVSDALNCAVAVQKAIKEKNETVAQDKRVQFRIGLNLGEVIVDRGEVYGNGVNVSARLETLAEPGGICISGAARDAIGNKLALAYDYLGEQLVKNIDSPVRAYRVVEPHGLSQRRLRFLLLKRLAAAPARVFAGLVVLIVAAAFAWQFTRSNRQADDSVLALPKGPSVAVLPFTNLSGDPTQDYFTDGVSEEIITELTRFHDLFVIARNSTMRYKGKAVDVREVGRDLGVSYVLESSMRRSGETIRVTAQLLDASKGTHLWAETYERKLTAPNLFAVQDEITRQVVATVAQPYGVIARSAMSAAKAKRPESLSAYECVLSYWTYEETLTPTEHLRMRGCLETAVQTEPLYVEAWALLSSVYRHEVLFQFNPRSEPPPPLDRALTAAQRAVELDPRNEIARLFLAVTHFHRREFEAFVREGERALALSPNNSYVLAAAGMWLSFSGQWDRGMTLIKKAQALNPYHPGWYHFPLGINYYRRGEYEQAAAEFTKINTPGWYQMHAGLAASYGQLGRRQEAQVAAKKLLERKPDFLADPRQFYRTRNLSNELGEPLMDGLRKAGLDISPQSK